MINNTHYAVLDIESSGLSPDKNAMIELAVIVLNHKLEEVERYSEINQMYDDRAVQQQALDVHGITMKEINSGITIQESVKRVQSMFSKYSKGKDKVMLIGHNMSFDIGFIRNAWEYCKVDLLKYTYEQYMCTMRMSHLAWNDDSMENFKLGTCVARIGAQVSDSHRAIGDTVVTAELFKYHVMNMRRVSQSITTIQPQSTDKYARGHSFQF